MLLNDGFWVTKSRRKLAKAGFHKANVPNLAIQRHR